MSDFEKEKYSNKYLNYYKDKKKLYEEFMAQTQTKQRTNQSEDQASDDTQKLSYTEEQNTIYIDDGYSNNGVSAYRQNTGFSGDNNTTELISADLQTQKEPKMLCDLN